MGSSCSATSSSSSLLQSSDFDDDEVSALGLDFSKRTRAPAAP